MPQKFELSSCRTNDILHLKLLGEFDGSSACELVKKIKEDGAGASQIIVDTTEVRSIHPFGRMVLQNRLGQVSRKLIGLTFKGQHKNQFEL
jgi:anti-anti-sigma regulatory factor